MAIAYLRLNAGQKSKGHSAVAKSRYINRLGRYGDLDPVLHSGSGNLPDQFSNPFEYWKAADEHERANAVVFREAVIALPIELAEYEQALVAEEIAKEIAVSKSGDPLAYQFAVHQGKEEGKNPHVHVMMSERVDDREPRPAELFFRQQQKKEPARGGAPKMPNTTSELKRRTEYMKKCTERVLNRYLDNAHQIDFRAHEKTGKFPQIHLGPANHKLMLEGGSNPLIERYRAIDRYNADVDRLREIEQLEAELEEEINTVEASSPSEIRTDSKALPKQRKKQETEEEKVAQLQKQKGLRATLLAAQKEIDEAESQEELERERPDIAAGVERGSIRKDRKNDDAPNL